MFPSYLFLPSYRPYIILLSKFTRFLGFRLHCIHSCFLDHSFVIVFREEGYACCWFYSLPMFKSTAAFLSIIYFFHIVCYIDRMYSTFETDIDFAYDDILSVCTTIPFNNFLTARSQYHP